MVKSRDRCSLTKGVLLFFFRMNLNYTPTCYVGVTWSAVNVERRLSVAFPAGPLSVCVAFARSPSISIQFQTRNCNSNETKHCLKPTQSDNYAKLNFQQGRWESRWSWLEILMFNFLSWFMFLTPPANCYGTGNPVRFATRILNRNIKMAAASHWGLLPCTCPLPSLCLIGL